MPSLCEKFQLFCQRELLALIVVYEPDALDNFVVVFLYKSLGTAVGLVIQLGDRYASEVLHQVRPQAMYQPHYLFILSKAFHVFVPSSNPLVVIQLRLSILLPLLLALEKVKGLRVKHELIVGLCRPKFFL